MRNLIKPHRTRNRKAIQAYHDETVTGVGVSIGCGVGATFNSDTTVTLSVSCGGVQSSVTVPFPTPDLPPRTRPKEERTEAGTSEVLTSGQTVHN